MQGVKDLFIHELGDIFDAEQRIVQILPVMAQETPDPEIKKTLEQHLDETKQQINNLEQCFQVLGTKPTRTACFAIEGLKKEHDSFINEHPSSEVLTMFNLDGAAKTEHYEIASYQGLIDRANFMGQKKCAELLHQNLMQEEAMAQRVVLFSRELSQKACANP
jgi:ferritin-like metal-binding protein YciE